MKRIYFLSLLFVLGFCLAQPAFSQRGSGGRNMERIHTIKVGYITDRIHLTAQQASRFWPVYDQYEADMRALRQEIRRKYRGQGQQNDSRQFIEDDLDAQEQIIATKRKYKDQFLQIISSQQLADLYVAEREFRKLLMQQLKNRGGR